jgi:hypothetical protein
VGVFLGERDCQNKRIGLSVYSGNLVLAVKAYGFGLYIEKNTILLPEIYKLKRTSKGASCLMRSANHNLANKCGETASSYTAWGMWILPNN